MLGALWLKRVCVQGQLFLHFFLDLEVFLAEPLGE